MQASLVVLFALFAVALSQVYYLPSNASQLTIGRSMGGYIPAQYSEDYGYIPSYAYVYIPSNVYHFNITLSSGNNGLGACYYGVDLLLRMDGYPCSDEDPFSDNFICTNYDLVGEAGYDEGNSVTEDFYPGTVSRSSDGVQSQFISGGYIYIGVRRGDEYDYNNTCGYTLLVQADYCGNGSNVVASSTDGDDAEDTYCATYQTVAANNSTPFVSLFLNANSLIYKYTAPANIGSINITINATNEFLVYGTSYQTYQSSSYSQCYDSSDSNGDFYYLTLTCSGIPAGDFYITLTSYDSDNLNGSIIIAPLVCYSGIGPFCNSPFVDLTNLTTVGYVRIPRLLDDQFAYGYMPLTSTLVTQYDTILLALQSTNNTYLYVGRNRFATNDNDDEFYEEGTPDVSDAEPIAISTNDAQLFNGQAPGLYWISIQCYGDDSCSDIILFGDFFSGNTTGSSTTSQMKMSTTSRMTMTSGMNMMNMTMTTGKAPVATSGKPAVVTSGTRATTAPVVFATTSPRTTGIARASSNAAAVVASIFVSLIAIVFAC